VAPAVPDEPEIAAFFRYFGKFCAADKPGAYQQPEARRCDREAAGHPGLSGKLRDYLAVRGSQMVAAM